MQTNPVHDFYHSQGLLTAGRASGFLGRLVLSRRTGSALSNNESPRRLVQIGPVLVATGRLG
jgi:hypothetical protein